ncbi:hypothetical protein QJS10_CPA01g02834 [Acorus calamus]|uniref:Uncharacterized protein n=1 Tax=Acorus calamus TaxID=4465 RepID=A0AAV9FR18_ACOCL|nr:hypothetical protein QJS10_CPA01g02834 [Acorus calamus]
MLHLLRHPLLRPHFGSFEGDLPLPRHGPGRLAGPTRLAQPSHRQPHRAHPTSGLPGPSLRPDPTPTRPTGPAPLPLHHRQPRLGPHPRLARRALQPPHARPRPEQPPRPHPSRAVRAPPAQGARARLESPLRLGPPIQNQEQLLHLDLQKNCISGPLPPSLPPTLRYLSVSGNQMSGALPALPPDLGYLDLSMNAFTGDIPLSAFRSATALLQRNNFTGPLTDCADMVGSVDGWTVDLSHNALSGDLPGFLAEAESLFMNNNQFTGAVPVEYVRNVYTGRMRTLYLQHNFLSGFPLPAGSPLPESAALCVSYNCMVPPVQSSTCPASAGDLQYRPLYQCPVFNNITSIHL